MWDHWEQNSYLCAPLPPRPSSLSKSYGNLATSSSSSLADSGQSQSLDTLDHLPSHPSLEDAHAISVKERTKTFNRMASTDDVQGLTGPTANRLPSAIKRRNSRAVEFPSRCDL